MTSAPDQNQEAPQPSSAEQGSKESPPGERGKASAQSSAAHDSVSQFILVAKSRIPEERVRGDLRVTPRGLFIHKDSLDVLIECYQRWLHEVAPHVEDRSPAKIAKRMFGSSEPPLYYLIEQKRTLVGHLIETPVQNPPSLGLPVYLGSLESGSEQLHPRDPLLQCMPQLEAQQTAQGIECKLQLRDRKVQFKIEIVKTFAKIISSSRVLSAKLPGEHLALRDALRVMVEELSSAHWSQPNQRLLLPWQVQKERGLECLVSGSVFWVVRPNGWIHSVFEREGRNLYWFLRADLGALAQDRRDHRWGAFEFSRGRAESCGRYRFFGKDYPLSPHALSQFVKGVLHSPPEEKAPSVALPVGSGTPSAPREIDWTRFSVRDCLQALGDIFLGAEQAEFFKVDRFLPPSRRGSYRYRQHGRWIFVLSGRDEIVDVIDKLSGARGEDRQGRRGNPGRGRGRGRGHRR